MTDHDGGCECGAIRYRMTSEPIFVNCCHCRDCQKSTGSAFTLHAMIERDRLSVLLGKERLGTTNGETRCDECGLLLWQTHRMFGENILFMRVGGFDQAERIKPDAHFFIRSKHPWVTIPQGVPWFEALPEEGEAPPAMSSASEARLRTAQGT